MREAKPPTDTVTMCVLAEPSEAPLPGLAGEGALHILALKAHSTVVHPQGTLINICPQARQKGGDGYRGKSYCHFQLYMV